VLGFQNLMYPKEYSSNSFDNNCQHIKKKEEKFLNLENKIKDKKQDLTSH